MNKLFIVCLLAILATLCFAQAAVSSTLSDADTLAVRQAFKRPSAKKRPVAKKPSAKKRPVAKKRVTKKAAGKKSSKKPVKVVKRRKLADLFKDVVGDFSKNSDAQTLEIPALALKLRNLNKIITKGKRRARKSKVCKNRCGCANTREPVCGASGRTHRNECLAKCAKDLVVKKGNCDDKCNSPLKRRRECRHAPFGKDSYRQICCSYLFNKSTKSRSDYKCKWSGAILKIESKYQCVWKKTDMGKRRHCCRFLRKWIGRVFKDGRKKCKFIGHEISEKKTTGCTWKQFGKYGKRKYCCKAIKTCLGKKCKTHTRTCVYKGAIFVNRLRESCSWRLKNSHCRQVRCCSKQDRCIIKSKKNKKCTTRDGKCRWVGKVLCQKKRTVCQWRKVGSIGRKKRCCSFRVVGGKRTKPTCKWVGCTIKRKLVSSCKIVKRSKKVRQTQCCRWTSSCKCGKCTSFAKTCRFVGKPLVKKSAHKCFWTRIGKNRRQRKCCKVTKKCSGKKCHTKKTCSLVGLAIKTSTSSACKWIKRGKGKKQRQCCIITTQCVGKKCSVVKRTCRLLGLVLVHLQKGCKWRKHGTYGKRQFCCKWKRVCKGKACKNTKKICRFRGKVIKTVPKSNCTFAPYGNAQSKRKYCCKWFNYCEGKKCSPIKKRCVWRGAVHKNTIKLSCKIVKRIGGKQKKCCRSIVKCRDSVCRNIKTTCKFVGKLSKRNSIRSCFFKQTGRFTKRKYCCRKTKSCKGDACKLRKGKCGWTGPTYTRRPVKKCKWQRKGKKVFTRCCTWFRSCIGERCTRSGRKCSRVGKSIKYVKSNNCKWRRYKKNFKRQYCCKRVATSKKARCVWRGKKIVLTTTFWKKQRACGKQVCCFRLYQCKKGQKCVFRKNVGCTPRRPKGQVNICTSWGSGHVTPFAQKTYSVQRAGDFNLISSANFACHIRVVAGKRVVRTRAIACRVNGVVIESVGRRGNKFSVSGKTIKLKSGQVYKLAKGGFIKQVSRNTFMVDSNSVGFVEASFHSRFVSAVARVANTGLFAGLCQNKKSDLNGLGIFSKLFVPKRTTLKRVGCPKRKQYVAECSKLTKKRQHLIAACVFDRCSGLKLSVQKHMISEKKYVRRLPLKTCRFRSVPNKKGCKGYYCCTTKIVGRGKAKSKCHYTHVKCPKSKGKKVRISACKKHTGIFRHLMTGKSGIQTRYTTRKNVGILTGVAVQCGKSKFVVSSYTGSVKARYNGKKLTKKTKQTKTLNVKRTHKNSWKVVCKNFNARIIYNKNLKSLVLQTKLKTKIFSGVVATKKFRQNRVGRRNSWFRKWIAYVKLSGKGFKKFAGKAKRACKRAILKKSCRKAVKQTGNKKTARDFAKKNKASNKRIEKTQKKQNKKVLKQVAKEARAHFCRATGDPHFSTFAGVKFDNYQIGDFVFAEGPQVVVHTRQDQWYKAAVHVRFIVKTSSNGHLVDVAGRDEITIDGKLTPFKVGQVVTLEKGGKVTRKSVSQYKIEGIDGSYVDANINQAPFPGAWPQKCYIDLVYFAPDSAKVKGFCQSKDQVLKATGLFGNPRAIQALKKGKDFTQAEKAVALDKCRKAGILESHLKECAFDVLRSDGNFDPKNFRKIEGIMKKDEKRFEKVIMNHIQKK